MSAKQRKNRCHLKRTAAIGFGFHSVASSYHSIEDPNCDRGLRSAAPAKMKNFHDVKMSVMSAKQRKNRCHLKRTAAIGFGFHSVASSYHSVEDPNCDRGLRSAAPAKMKNFHDVENVSNERKAAEETIPFEENCSNRLRILFCRVFLPSIDDPNCDRGLRSAAPAKMKNFHDVKMSVMSAKQRKKRSHLKRTAAIGFGFHSVASSYHSVDDPNCDRGLRSAAPAKMKKFHDVKMSVMSAKQRKNRCHLKRTAAIGFGFHSVASSYHSIDDPNCDRGLRSAAPAKMKNFHDVKMSVMSAKQRKNRCHLKRTAAIGFGFHSVASSYHSSKIQTAIEVSAALRLRK